MRIPIETLEKIKDELGSFEVGEGYDYNAITLRFGYWKKVDIEKLQSFFHDYIQVEENLVDEDEDCGRLYNYIVSNI